MTPAQLVASFVSGFEGLLSTHPADNGNYYDRARYLAGQPQRRGCGELVGSMRGVTAYALVQYRLACGVAPSVACAVTRADMAAIDLDRATAIGVALFYRAPGLSNLAWNRVTASILDKAWGSGPKATIQRLQRLLGVAVDGRIDPGGATVRAYAAWIARVGEPAAAIAWGDVRDAWDKQIASNEGAADPDRVFLSGWMRRTDSWLPGTSFWRTWK